MTMSLPALLILLVIAAVCGAVGKALAGSARGGLLVSIVLGFIGAALFVAIIHLISRRAW